MLGSRSVPLGPRQNMDWDKLKFKCLESRDRNNGEDGRKEDGQSRIDIIKVGQKGWRGWQIMERMADNLMQWIRPAGPATDMAAARPSSKRRSSITIIIIFRLINQTMIIIIIIIIIIIMILML